MVDVPDKSDPPRPSGLRPPQFDLRTLLFAIGCVGSLLGIHVAFGSLAATIATLMVLAVCAHFLGAALGHKLGALGSKNRASQPIEGSVAVRRPLRKEDYAPTTHLGSRKSLGWPMVVCTLAGAVLCSAGGVLLFSTLLQVAKPAQLAIGGIAFGVLGAIGSFGAFGFVRVVFSAVRQATREESRPR